MKSIFKGKHVFYDNFNYIFLDNKEGISSKFKKKCLASKFSDFSEDDQNVLESLEYCGQIKFAKYAISYDFTCDGATLRQPKTFLDAFLYIVNKGTKEKQYLVCNNFVKTKLMNLPAIITNGQIYTANELNAYYGGTHNHISSLRYNSYHDTKSIKLINKNKLVNFAIHFSCEATIRVFLEDNKLKDHLLSQLNKYLTEFPEITVDFMYLTEFKKIYDEYYFKAFDIYRNSINDYMNAYNKAKAETFYTLCNTKQVVNPNMKYLYK